MNATIELCEICKKPITWEQWDDRHTTPSGGDCHAECCPSCNADEDFWDGEFDEVAE